MYYTVYAFLAIIIIIIINPPPPDKTKQQQQKNWRYSGPTLERLCVGQSKERDWLGRTMQGRGR